MTKKYRKLKRRVRDLEYSLGYEQRRIDKLEKILQTLTESDDIGYA
jgi:predicted RNase H-like nuclease (RuvC/YqgF family)